MIKIIFLSFSLLFFNGCGGSPKNEGETKPPSEPTHEVERLTVCSFNIQFVGHFKKKDDPALASLVKDYDIVVVQELVAPLYEGTYPDGSSFNPDAEAKEFFDAMEQQGFKYILSGEDTGTNDEIHKNSTATEWWVCFYKDDKVSKADDLPNGFLAEDRSNHSDFERVPYAFAFRAENTDFVIISTHLNPGGGNSDKMRRKEEFNAISEWITNNSNIEKDIIILGDMNIEDVEELADITPEGYLSLNDECRKTNTTLGSSKPYDHVMYNTTYSVGMIDTDFDLQVVNLIEAMKDYWTSEEPYPGDPYDHNLFKQYYSDHHPVVFKIILESEDDD